MATTLEFLTEVVELAEQLQAGRETMLDPQDLPGRFGRAVKAVDRLLQATGSSSVLGGGWAVWRHGYTARVTQDLDIVLAADKIDDILRTAPFAGFDVLPQQPGRWPKMVHKESGIRVDILPEGGRPGTASRPAPTTIPNPAALGAAGPTLRYIHLPALVELKLAAGRARDDNDVIELIRANPVAESTIRGHIVAVHTEYVAMFDRLVARATEDDER
jgi:hypothetical protein